MEELNLLKRRQNVLPPDSPTVYSTRDELMLVKQPLRYSLGTSVHTHAIQPTIVPLTASAAATKAESA